MYVRKLCDGRVKQRHEGKGAIFILNEWGISGGAIFNAEAEAGPEPESEL